MDTANLDPLVEDLSNNIDDLEESLEPLLKTALSHSASKLPLLDKAKLYVLVTYAIESILFSCLRLNDVDAKSHPIFQELARVKEYFGKIKAAETAGTKRNTTLDKEATSRFIKHGLAGNEKYDRGREERIAREKAGAKRKFDEIQVGTHTRFDGSAKKIKSVEAGQDGIAAGDEDIISGQDGTGQSTATTDAEMAEPEPLEQWSNKAEKKAAKRQRRREKRLLAKRSSESLLNAGEPDVDDAQQRNSDEDDNEKGQGTQKTPSTTTEALEALLRSSLPGEEGNTPKTKKKKRKSKGEKLEDERADEMK